MKCFNCDTEFEAKRITAKYCSDNCRVKSFLKKNKKEAKVTETKLQVLYNSLLEMVGKMNYQPITETAYVAPQNNAYRFDEVGQWEESKIKQQTFQELLNGMALLRFPDEKEEYAQKIKAATHLPEKQIKLLLTNLWS